MFLLGRHAILGQEPPTYLRFRTATRLPSPANVHAATVEPVPPPRITTSNSSGCDFLRTWADGEVSVLFMLFFLSEQQMHSWLALISFALQVRAPISLSMFRWRLSWKRTAELSSGDVSPQWS